jgi:hypothetical protein
MYFEQALVEEAKRAGFFIMPLTIDEFIARLGLEGSIYPAWMEHLRKLYPSPIHTAHNYVLLTGAIGTGKSTVSKIAALYTAYKILCLKDLKAFNLFITKPIQFVFFHVKIEKSRIEFLEYVKDVFENHDLFNEIRDLRLEQKLKPIPIDFQADGSKSNSSIGGDVIFYVFSEANFVNEGVIRFKLEQAYNRFKSRFLAAKDYIGNIIIDTSASYEGSVVDFLGHRAEDFYVVRMSQWEAKAHTGLFFRKGTILVYTGGILGEPKILGDKDSLSPAELSVYEPERIIEVPKEFEKEFMTNIYEALISLAGVSVRPPNSLFTREMVSAVMRLPRVTPDVVSIMQLDTMLDPILSALPIDRAIAIHIDTSIRGDNTGIAIGYWYDEQLIHIPVAFGIHNEGDDIPMNIIEGLITQIAQQRQVSIVTADTYQSYKLLQDITIRTRIKTQTISVDQNPSIYFSLKKAIIDRTINITQNHLLIDELTNLRYKIVGASFKPKIDHPPNSSKDIADAVASVHYVLLDLVAKGKAINTIITQEIQNYKNKLYRQMNLTGHIKTSDFIFKGR